MTLPFADPVVIALLVRLGHTADRVTLAEVGQVPSTRVAHVGDADDVSTWSRAPVYQIEVWADDAFTAGTIATAIANDWPRIGRTTTDTARVTGTWVESHPRALPDPESDHARYVLEVGLNIHALEV